MEHRFVEPRDAAQSHTAPVEPETTTDASLIVAISRAGRVVRIGRGGERLFGRACDGLLGSRLGELGLVRSVAADCLRGMRRVFRTGKASAFELVRTDGDAQDHAIDLLPEVDARDDITVVLVVLREATPSALAVQACHAGLQRQRVDQDRFIASAMHALRSSLNGIHLWSHVLEQQMRGAIPGPLTRRASVGIRAGVRQQLVLIERLQDAASRLSVAQPDTAGTHETIDTAIDAARRVLLAAPCAHRPRPGPVASLRTRKGPPRERAHERRQSRRRSATTAT